MLCAALPLIKVAAIPALIALLLEDIYVWAEGGESVLGDLLGPFEEFQNNFPKIYELIQMVKDAFVTLVDAWKSLINGDLGDAFDKFGEYFIKLHEIAFTALQNIGKAIFDFVLSKLPSLDSFLLGLGNVEASLQGYDLTAINPPNPANSNSYNNQENNIQVVVNANSNNPASVGAAAGEGVLQVAERFKIVG